MLVHQRVTVVLSEAHPPWPGVGRGALRAAPGGEAAQRPRGASQSGSDNGTGHEYME